MTARGTREGNARRQLWEHWFFIQAGVLTSACNQILYHVSGILARNVKIGFKIKRCVKKMIVSKRSSGM